MSYGLLAPFYDWIAPRFSRYISPRVVTAKVDQLAPDPCDLLDIGVGTGLSIAPYLASQRFSRIVGIDPSAAMIKRCRAKFPQIELHTGKFDDGQDLGRFDIIQSCGAVEHIPNVEHFFLGVASALKPSGHFVFTYEPMIAGKFWQSPRAPHLGTLGRAPVYRRKPEDIRSALAAAGFEMLAEEEFTAYLGLRHFLIVARLNPESRERRTLPMRHEGARL